MDLEWTGGAFGVFCPISGLVLHRVPVLKLHFKLYLVNVGDIEKGEIITRVIISYKV